MYEIFKWSEALRHSGASCRLYFYFYFLRCRSGVTSTVRKTKKKNTLSLRQTKLVRQSLCYHPRSLPSASANKSNRLLLPIPPPYPGSCNSVREPQTRDSERRAYSKRRIARIGRLAHSFHPRLLCSARFPRSLPCSLRVFFSVSPCWPGSDDHAIYASHSS